MMKDPSYQNWTGMRHVFSCVGAKEGNHSLDVTEEASFEHLGFSPAPDLVTFRNGSSEIGGNHARKSNGDSDCT